MVYQIVGVRRVNYVSKKTNKEVKGYSFNCTYPYDEDEETSVGYGVLEVFMNDDNVSSFMSNFETLDEICGTNVDILYNRFGRVDRMVIV